VFPKVNQPSNPSVCCQRDKLYTNPSFVAAFLNPCFSPLYLKVYSDTKSIFIVKVSLLNWNKISAQKYISVIFPAAKFGARIPPFGHRFLPNQQTKNSTQIRAPILTDSANFNFSNFESLSQQQVFFFFFLTMLNNKKKRKNKTKGKIKTKLLFRKESFSCIDLQKIQEII